MDKFIQIHTFTRITQVSRETITSLKKYENLLISANKNLNLIGKSTIDQIWHRHFLDSAQVIDFIDKNDKNLADLGSGAGFPGLVIAILAKDRNIPIKINLIDKSVKKTEFLREIVNELKLDVQVNNQNILEMENKLNEDLIIARAFKPLEIILKLMHKKTRNWKKFFIYLGKTGENELLRVSKTWDIKYKKRRSITSVDSKILEIDDFKKK